MHIKFARNNERGQILLIVVVAVVVSLTVGLSAASRTITNTRISTEEANSQKALSAAEAGIEELVNSQSIIAGDEQAGTGLKTLSNNSNFNATAVQVDANNNETILVDQGAVVKQDEGADVWLSNYPDFTSPRNNITLTVYWKNTDNGTCDLDNASSKPHPALEIAIIHGDRTTPSMLRFTADACSGRTSGFGTPNPGGPTSVDGVEFENSYTLPVPAPGIQNGYIARIIPLYSDTVLAIRSSAGLPAQGYEITSIGKSGETARQVNVYQGFPRLPVEFFPYNLFLP